MDGPTTWKDGPQFTNQITSNQLHKRSNQEVPLSNSRPMKRPASQFLVEEISTKFYKSSDVVNLEMINPSFMAFPITNITPYFWDYKVMYLPFLPPVGPLCQTRLLKPFYCVPDNFK